MAAPDALPSAARLIWKIADLLEQNLEEFAQLESLDNGKPLTVARVADVPLAIDMFRYMAGWTTKIEGHTIPISAGGGREISGVHVARARGCRRPDHPLEFSAIDGRLEAWSGARHRLHRDPQARRTNSARPRCAWAN